MAGVQVRNMLMQHWQCSAQLWAPLTKDLSLELKHEDPVVVIPAFSTTDFPLSVYCGKIVDGILTS